jgi:hypothetical protein
MMEFISTLLTIYAMIGFHVSILYPMMREEFSDERFFIRKPGETGAELIGKTILAFLFWPAPAGAIMYYWIIEFIIPWLTNPK